MALTFELGADVTKFDRAMNKAKEIVVQKTGDMLATVQSASKGMDTALAAVGGSGVLGPGVKTAAGYLLAYKGALLAVSAAVATLGVASSLAADQVERLDAIAKGSKQSDVSSTFFQNWINQAEKAGIAAKDAEDALTKARDAVKDKRDAIGNFQGTPVGDLLKENVANRGGVNKQALNDYFATNDTEARIKIVIDAIRELNTEAKKTFTGDLNRVGDKLTELTFGSDKFADSIRKAADGAAALQLVGIDIFPPDLVKRSEELNERLREAHRTMSTGLMPISDDLSRLGLEIKEGWVSTEEAIARCVTVAGNLYKTVKDLGDLIPNLKLGEKVANYLKDQFPSIQPSAQDMLRMGLTGAEKAARTGANPFADPGGIAARAASLDASSVRWGTPANVPLPPARPDELDKRKKAVATASDADAVQTYLSSLQRSVDVLRAETEAYGKSNTGKTIAIELARAEAAARTRGTALTEAEIASTTELANKKAQLAQALADLKQHQDQMNELGGYVGNQLVDAFDSILTQGASVNQVLQSITSSLAKAALQAAILGQGPLAGLLGSAPAAGGTSNLGGIIGALLGRGGGGGFADLGNGIRGFATGGNFPGGKPIIVGERGPEIIMPSVSGTVIPNHVIGAASGGGGSGVNVQVINQSSAQVAQPQVTQGPDGRTLIKLMIQEEITGGLQKNSPIAQAFQNRYGLKRTNGRG